MPRVLDIEGSFEEIPVLLSDKQADARLAGRLLRDLQSIGPSIGLLRAARRRCRRTDTPLHRQYEKNQKALEARQEEIVSFITMLLRAYGGPNT